MGLLYEVYTLPWDSGGFKKKFFWLPVEPGSGTGTVEFLTSSGEGSVNVLLDKLEEAGRDLTEIVSDTTSSLIRVIDCLPDGTRTIIDEWVCDRPARVHDNARKVTISGPKLKAKTFDSQTIPAFDTPANPTINPDHVWGGENILSDPGFENANKQNETYEIDLDGATGGSFVLHLDGNSTPSIAFDASEGTVENRIEDLPEITDVLVTERGSGFTIEFHNPGSPERDGLGLLTWTPSLSGTDNNEESLERTNAGLILPSSSWTRSQGAEASNNPHIHGTYASDGYRLTEGSEPVRSGDFAGRINGLTQFAGIQQLIRVLPSTRHQASIWFWSSDASETFRLVMRDRYENLIAWKNVTNATPSTWTEVTLDFVTELADGTPITEMVFRFAQTQDHNPFPYYIDDAALRPGAPITTWGEIINALMDLKTSEFDWIDHSTVTNSLDSGGVAWPRDESVTAFFGESYGQFWDKGVDLEYEWDLRPKVTPSGSLTHDLVWYGPGGMDDSPSAGIYPNASITGGDSLTRTPAFNKVRVEGADGRYVEAEDAASVGDIGPLEKHVKDTSLHSDDSLNARANGLLTYEAANRNAVHFQMVEHKTLPRPGTHFRPGDTIPMQLPPGLSKTSKRVQSFSYTNSFPTQYLVTGSRVLSGEAAAYSLLWRLWRRFENPDRDKGGGGFGAGEGKGTPSFVFAASDAPDSVKAKADVVCNGINDQATIQEFINQFIPTSPHQGFRVVLTEGTFNIEMAGQAFEGIRLDYGVIQGMGSGATILNAVSDPGVHDNPVVYLATSRATVRDLSIQGGSTTRVTAIHSDADDTHIENVYLSTNGYGVIATGFWTTISHIFIDANRGVKFLGASFGSLHDSYIGIAASDPGVEIDNSDGISVHDNSIETNGTPISIVNGSTNYNIHDNLINGVPEGGVGDSNTSAFTQTGTLTTGTGSFKLPFTLDAEIISVQLAVGTSPTGADLIVDVNKNGTTIFTTQANRPTVPDADADGVGAETTPDVTSISEGEYLTVDIDQIGSTIAGEDLTVVVEWRPS